MSSTSDRSCQAWPNSWELWDAQNFSTSGSSGHQTYITKLHTAVDLNGFTMIHLLNDVNGLIMFDTILPAPLVIYIIELPIVHTRPSLSQRMLRSLHVPLLRPPRNHLGVLGWSISIISNHRKMWPIQVPHAVFTGSLHGYRIQRCQSERRQMAVASLNSCGQALPIHFPRSQISSLLKSNLKAYEA